MRQRLIFAAAAAVAFGGLVMGQAAQDMGQPGGAAQPAGAQPAGTAWSSQSKEKTSMTDQQQMTPQAFIHAAAQANNLDYQVADQVGDQASEPQVKQLAKDLKQQHQKARNELKSIASKKNIDFKEDLQPDQKQKLDQLKEQSKDQLTQSFIRQQMDSYQNCISKYQQAAQKLDDPDLKSFAQQQITKLQGNVNRLQSVASAVGVDVGPTAQPAGAQMQGADQQKQQDQTRQPGDQPIRNQDQPTTPGQP